MALSWPAKKDPNAEKDYAVDWGPWLNGDTIQSVTWTVPAGISKTDEEIVGTQAVIWLSGGTAGTTYSIVCRVVTAGGRTDERTVKVKVADQ